MSAFSQVGSLTSPTATGNQSITGIGFKPKAIIFWGFYNPTGDGSLGLTTAFYGIVTDTTHRGAMVFTVIDNNVISSNYGRGHANDACIYAANTAIATTLKADLVSMDADGFTINWSTVQATGYIVNFMCLGGSDLTNATVVQNTTKTTTGSQAYTGVGFQPDALFVISAGHSTAPDSLVQNNAHPFISFVTAAAQKAIALDEADDGTNYKPQTLQKTDVLAMLNGAGGQTLDATLTSLDADGFTLNYVAADATARYFWTLCLKGGSYKVGTITQPTSNGALSISNLGFKPSGVILASQGKAASASIQNNGGHIFGAASYAPISRGVVSGDELYNTNPTNVSQNLDRTNVFKSITAAHGSPTVNAAADLTSFDSDDVNLNFGTTDATAREIVYMIFGGNKGTGLNNYQSVKADNGISVGERIR